VYYCIKIEGDLRMENKDNGGNGADNTNIGYVNGDGKLHLESRKTRYSGHILYYEFNKFFYREMLKLLVNVHEENIFITGLKVTTMMRRDCDGLRSPLFSKAKNGLLNGYIEDVITILEFNETRYMADFRVEKDRMGCLHYCINFSYQADRQPDEKIGFEILKLAFEYTSDYNKGCVELSYNGDREMVSYLDSDFVQPPTSSINNVFVREEIKDDIGRFVYTFKNFNKFGVPLRYLLSGKPGLGKTEIVRSVINECSQAGIVIIPKQMNGADWLTFEFAKLFKPALVCIDDIDLIFGKREEGFKRSLGTFLTMLDGIMQNNFFLIATTNDKKLVDMAASRPGRFDEIIDFGEFERKYYGDLINKRTENEKILSLLDEEIYDVMEEKKVTGAYIVNLVKQMQVLTEMNPGFSKEDLKRYINRNYKGFYKNQAEGRKTFGF
jgi:hypothetical protein